MRVLYVNVLPYDSHPGIDALAHGLDHGLRQAGIELRTLTTDVRTADWVERQTAAIQRGIDAQVDGIIVYVLDPTQPEQAVAAARQRGIPVFTLERPRYPVNASLVYPNFNHGVYMAEYLASLLPPQADVAVIGGPEVIDDIELVLGIVHGIQRSGLRLVNDPFVDRHRNREDVKEGGRADKPPAGAEWSNHRHAAETGQQVGLTTASSSKPGTPKIEMFSVVLSDANSLA